MSYLLEFRLDGLPKRTNNIKSWRMRFAEARKWKRAVFIAIDYAKRPERPLQKAKLTLVRHSSMPPDFDGLVSGFKHVIDGLIDAQVIVNDKFENIGQPEYRWEKAPQRNGFITVKVEAA